MVRSETFRRGWRALLLVEAAWVMSSTVAAVAAEDPPPDAKAEAQTETQAETKTDRPPEKVLSFGIDEIVVTASPLKRTAAELSRPVTVLSGKELLLKQQPTIGETLKYLPGVSSTYFGPGASRPVIRGLAGPRVSVLENGLVTLDASVASDDHAVTIDPLVVKKIEVLRGPATLRYGPNAVGGVVNAIDDRVPSKLGDEPIAGRVELRGASVDGSFGGAAVLEGSTGPLAYQLSGFGLTAGDLSIPGFARSPQLRAIDPLPPDEEAFGTLPNSAVENNGFAAGLSYVGDGFYVGAAPSLFRTNYGTVAEPDVTIDLASNRLDLAGGAFNPFPYFQSIEGKVRLVDYHHTELEGGEPATRFENQGYDLRLEAVHVPLDRFEGALGFQSYRSDFSAIGEEAFLPPTLTEAQSWFFIEEVDFDPVTLELGGRLDYTTIDSSGGENFGSPTSLSFVTGSGAVGLTYELVENQFAALNVAYTQRPPNYEELFANGPHIATDTFEIGNPDFGTERSLGFNLGYNGEASDFTWSLNGFYNRFWNFITIFPTGEEEDGLPVGVFEGVPAQFAGGEAEVAYHILDGALDHLHVIGRADYVWTDNRDTGEPLPRIPPLRFGGSLVYERDAIFYGNDAFLSQFDVIRAQAQDRVPQDALTTDGYTILDLSFSYALVDLGPVTPLVFLRLSNLADQDARDAASFLKDIAPYPGRSISGGVRVTF